jgi:DNA-binding MarR family transcriptional regulator
MNEWLLLSLIHDAPPSTLDMNELAEQLDVGKPHVTALFSDLQAVNYVEQTVDSKDKRRKIVHITDRGREVLIEVNAVTKEGLQSWIGDIPAAEFEQFLKITVKLANKAE